MDLTEYATARDMRRSMQQRRDVMTAPLRAGVSIPRAERTQLMTAIKRLDDEMAALEATIESHEVHAGFRITDNRSTDIWC